MTMINSPIALIRMAVDDMMAKKPNFSFPFATLLKGVEKKASNWLMPRMSKKLCIVKKEGKIKLNNKSNR
jgi:hypothetical protein